MHKNKSSLYSVLGLITALVLEVRTILYMVYSHMTTISISHGTIYILYYENHSLKLLVLVQIWYGCQWPFMTIYYSVK